MFFPAIHSPVSFSPYLAPVAAVCARCPSPGCGLHTRGMCPHIFPALFFGRKKILSMVFLSGTFILNRSTHFKVLPDALPHVRPWDTQGSRPQCCPSLSYKNQGWRKSPGSQTSPETSAGNRRTTHFTLSPAQSLGRSHRGGSIPGRKPSFIFPRVSSPARTALIYS